jgi:hypothetical protein
MGVQEEARPSHRRRLVFGAALAAAAAWPGGPLAFLPPALRWPLVAMVAAAALDRARRCAALLEGGAAALVLACFALLKLPGLHAGWSDENAYFYMAAQVARGLVPYRDFFFAHPPVHLAVPALAFRVLGFSEAVAQALPVGAQLLAGLLLWRAARRASPALGLLALVLHLSAYQVLMTASDLDGANLATAFTMAALLAATAGRPALAGGLGGLALGTVLYAAAGVGAVGLLCALRGRRAAALRFVAGLGGTLAVVLGAGWAAGGRAFLGGVFGFHLAKAADEGRAAVLGASGPAAAAGAWPQNLGVDLAGPGAARLLALHAPILCAAAVGSVALAVRWRRGGAGGAPDGPASSAEELALAGLAGVALSVGQQAALAEVYPFYLAPAFPWLALLGAYGVWLLWRSLEAPWPRARWGVLGLLALALHPLVERQAAAAAFPEERRRAGERVVYAWRDPEHLAALAQVSRALFWEDHRIRGEQVPPYRLALWNKAYTFSTARELAARVRAGSSPEETLTGGSTLAPLVALLADRRLACDEADTNQKRFDTGSLDGRAFLERALADGLRYVLASPRSHFTEQLMERDPTLAPLFEREAVFLDPALAHGGPIRLVLYRRREVATGADGGGR